MKEEFKEEHLDTLQKFGTAFQSKALSCLLTDRQFLEQTYDIVVPHYFESDANKWIAEKILWYFQEYKNTPTMDVFKKELDKIENNDVLKVSLVDQLKNVYRSTKASDLAYIKNEFLDFCKNQALKNAVLRSAEMLQKGQYESIKSIVDKALHAGKERNVGHMWAQDFSVRISDTARQTIATPWKCINDVLSGGLGPGELGCVVAPGGIGKSWFLRAIGMAALKQGKRVVDYTLELSEPYVGLRYDSILTGIEPQEIKKNKSAVEKELEKINGELIIKYYPTKSITINAISAHINRMTQLGYKPDMVIIDYADLMRSVNKSNAKHEELGDIYEEIRGLAGELQIPIWTASQSQRTSLQDDVIEADKIAGAYSKIFVSDVVMSVSRKLADKVSNTARVYMIKNRFGVDGKTWPCYMDLKRGQIQIYDENSVEGINVKSQMQSGSAAVTAIMSKKLMELGKNRNPSLLDLDSVDEEDNTIE